MRKISLWLCLLLVALPAAAEVIPFDLEVGFRFLDVNGNEDHYRTQINDRQGLLIRSFTMSAHDRTGMLEHFRIDASDLGTGPDSALRIELGKTEAYLLRLGYRRAEAFQAVPPFVTTGGVPLPTNGLIPGVHSFDRTRQIFDADLEFLPGRKLSPFIGFSRNTYDGPGLTTYTLGGDEFRLSEELEDTDQEIRAGLTFNTGMFFGQVTQGWRDASSTENLTLTPGANAGLNPGTGPFGRTITAQGITRTSETDISTPFTNAAVTGQITSRVRLIGQFTRFEAENEGFEIEDATGSFLSFGISRFFTGFNEEIEARAQNQTWRGSLRGEVSLFDGIELLAGYETDHRELGGAALVNTLFLNTLTFGGVDPRDVAEVLESENAVERDTDMLSAAVAARALGPFALRVGFSQLTQDLTVTPDLEEIVVPGGQGGVFERKINSFDVTGSARFGAFTAAASFRGDSADNPVLRTDFLDRDRIRVRAAWTAPRNFLTIGATAEQMNQENDRADIAYDAEYTQYSADVEIAPVTAFRLRASASRFEADTTALFRRPENFQVLPTAHAEEGTSIEGGFSVFMNKVSFDIDGTRFDNEGSIPFQIDRFRARLVWDFLARAGVAAEFAKDKYQDETFTSNDYDANRYGIFLRFRP